MIKEIEVEVCKHGEVKYKRRVVEKSKRNQKGEHYAKVQRFRRNCKGRT